MYDFDVDWGLLKQKKPIPGWRRYTHYKTEELHVTPMNPCDTMFHRYTIECRCEPFVIEYRGDTVIIHQAQDGRPGLFQLEKKMNNTDFNSNIIANARALYRGTGDEYIDQYDHALVDIMAKTLSVSYEEAEEMIKVHPPTDNTDKIEFGPDSSVHWRPTPEYNFLFLRQTQNYANQLLVTRGHVFLNEVIDMLGLVRTSDGAIMGWLRKGDGDDYIDFGVFSNKKFQYTNGPIMLSFNIDGVIWDKI